MTMGTISSVGTDATTTATGNSGTANSTFEATASGPHAGVSGTLFISTTTSSATLSGSFSSSSDTTTAAADVDAMSFANTAKTVAGASSDTSLLTDLTSGMMGSALAGTDIGSYSGSTQQSAGCVGGIASLYNGQGTSSMTDAPCQHQG
jgi:hypothetical protein